MYLRSHVFLIMLFYTPLPQAWTLIWRCACSWTRSGRRGRARRLTASCRWAPCRPAVWCCTTHPPPASAASSSTAHPAPPWPWPCSAHAQVFGRRYYEQMLPGMGLRSADACYVLAFSVIMLNTDLHNTQVGGWAGWLPGGGGDGRLHPGQPWEGWEGGIWDVCWAGRAAPAGISPVLCSTPTRAQSTHSHVPSIQPL